MIGFESDVINEGSAIGLGVDYNKFLLFSVSFLQIDAKFLQCVSEYSTKPSKYGKGCLLF